MRVMMIALLVVAISSFPAFLQAGDKTLARAKQKYDKEQQKIADEFEKAMAKHEKDSEASKAKLLKAYAEAIKRATKKGDLDAANKLLAEKKALEGGEKGEDDKDDTVVESKVKTKGVSLTKSKPISAVVGSSKFMVNDSGQHENPIIDGKACTEYFFAHADSTILYKIPKGIRYFSAIGYSLRDKRVKFIVKCDGKQLFESKPLNECADNIVQMTVKLPKKAKTLELIIKGVPPGDLHNRWSCWCYPRWHKK